MNIPEILNSGNLKPRRLFVWGMVAVLIICAVSTIYAIITGSYPENFLELILTAVALECYCVNSIILLKLKPSVRIRKRRIRYDIIGMVLCTVALILVLLRIWSATEIARNFAVPAFLLALSFTIAVVPVNLQADRHRTLSRVFWIIHRTVTPLFCIMVAVNFAFPAVYPHIQTVTWTLVLLEMLIVAVIMLLYSRPFTPHLELFATGTPDIYRDRSGKLYQVRSMNGAAGDTASGLSSESGVPEEMEPAIISRAEASLEDDTYTVTESEPVLGEVTEQEPPAGPETDRRSGSTGS